MRRPYDPSLFIASDGRSRTPMLFTKGGGCRPDTWLGRLARVN